MNARQFVIATAFAGLLACPAAVRADDPYRPAIEEVAEVKAPPDPSEEKRQRILTELRRIRAERQQIMNEREALRDQIHQLHSTVPNRTQTMVRLLKTTDHGVQDAPTVPVEWDGNGPMPRRVLK